MRDIGRVLRDERMARGLDIGDIAKQTCINPYYLRAMEDGRFNIIPKVFDKGYLKIYAKALHLDMKPLLALYDEKKTGAPDQHLSTVKTA